MRGYPQWRWHLDEAFVKVNGKLCYLWRAVDHEGEVLEAVVTAKRDKAAALKFLKRIMKKYGRPLSVVTDGLCSYPAAMKEIGNADRQEAGRRLNNRAENSHQPFRRRERAMQRFRSMKTLQKFSSVHAQVTTISIRSAISSPARFTNKGAPPRWPSGAPSRPNRRLGLPVLRPTQTTCRCSDKAPWPPHAAFAASRIGRNRPIAAPQDRPTERAGSARKRSSIWRRGYSHRNWSLSQSRAYCPRSTKPCCD